MNREAAAIGELCAVMSEQYGAGAEFEMELADLIGKARADHHQRQQYIEAAQLLPHGVERVIACTHKSRSTCYRWAQIGRKLSRAKYGG